MSQPQSSPSKFLPMSRAEMQARGWNALDVLLIGGDAYVDHPSFGLASLGRYLESLGLRVGIVAQPRFDTPEHSNEDLLVMGRPELFVGISSGTVDSMINNYTANKRPRSDDMYAEGGLGGKRPDYASIVYSKMVRAAFPETPVVVGGVEASLRRLAHYDYWQNRIRPSILTELDCDLVVFGMGERPSRMLCEELVKARAAISRPLSRTDTEVQEALRHLRSQRGFAFVTTKDQARELQPRLTLPSFEEVRDDKKKFAKAAYFIEYEASPYNGKRLIQYHGSKAVVINPPSLPLTTSEMDALYRFSFTKEQHPRYKGKIPAAEMIRFSIAATRGCFGGCSFCAITLHQGRVVQSRSQESVIQEAEKLNKVPGFTGVITDVGGPTANMYGIGCKSEKIQSQCRKLSCLHPKPCPHLQANHSSQIDLLRKVSAVKGVRRVFVASGLRYDLALHDKQFGKAYLRDLISHHVGGHLKVAPEHLDPEVLSLMKKPPAAVFEEFCDIFDKVSEEAGKEQYIVPYFISGFPGSTHDKMEKVTRYMTARGWKLQQVQGFIPTPMTLATAMYWCGIDPASKKPLFIAKEWADRKMQQALLQPHRTGNREILRRAKRSK